MCSVRTFWGQVNFSARTRYNRFLFPLPLFLTTWRKNNNRKYIDVQTKVSWCNFCHHRHEYRLNNVTGWGKSYQNHQHDLEHGHEKSRKPHVHVFHPRTPFCNETCLAIKVFSLPNIKYFFITAVFIFIEVETDEGQLSFNLAYQSVERFYTYSTSFTLGFQSSLCN